MYLLRLAMTSCVSVPDKYDCASEELRPNGSRWGTISTDILMNVNYRRNEMVSDTGHKSLWRHLFNSFSLLGKCLPTTSICPHSTPGPPFRCFGGWGDWEIHLHKFIGCNKSVCKYQQFLEGIHYLQKQYQLQQMWNEEHCSDHNLNNSKFYLVAKWC